MSRRTAASVITAASLLASVAQASAVDADFPRAGCSRAVVDDAGDAKYTLSGTGATAVPRPDNASVDGLDILTVALRTTDTDFKAYVAIKDLNKAFGTIETAYAWDITFENADGTKFVLMDMMTNATWDQTTVKAPSSHEYPKGTYLIGQTLGVFDGVKRETDKAKGFVVISVPLAQLTKGFPSTPMKVGTTEISKIAATSYAYIPYTGAGSKRPADVAATDVKYLVGDEYCFGPPPAALSAFAAPKVQYGDTTKLTATLKSEAGTALAGKTVQFTVPGEPGMPLKGVTNASGVASVTYKATKTAGTHPVTVFFPGDDTDGKTTLAGTVVVAPEVTKFNALAVARPTSTTRKVTATLLDDDKRAVAGQKVSFFVNGKRVATLVTNSKGQAVYSGAKPGQTVHATFTAVSGKYAAATAKAVKV